MELANTLREAFAFNIPMTPAVVLPLLVIGAIFVAYVVYFVTLRIVRAERQSGHPSPPMPASCGYWNTSFSLADCVQTVESQKLGKKR
jgi:hypothetical protein